jgi:hypothetical protein
MFWVLKKILVRGRDSQICFLKVFTSMQICGVGQRREVNLVGAILIWNFPNSPGFQPFGTQRESFVFSAKHWRK